GAPAASGEPIAVPANGAVKVSWTKPADNGSALTAYTVTTYSNSQVVQTTTFDPTTTTRTISALTNGTSYTFTVAASNGWGTGPPSPPTDPVTAGAPTMPTSVTATAGTARATVHWTTPSTNNGSAITA